jgi:hypothetical protein
MFVGQQGWRLGEMVLDTICLEQIRGIIKHIPQELMIPFVFAFTLFWFLRTPQPSISLLSCHQVDAKGSAVSFEGYLDRQDPGTT